LPKAARKDEEAIDASDIRKILLACNNCRLKAYLLVLASGGMRAVEALAIRYRDVNFTINPTRVRIRKEFAKTRVSRDIYISDEATVFLKQWLDWKYREDRIIKNGKRLTSHPMPKDLVFSSFIGSNPAPHQFAIIRSASEKELQTLAIACRRREGHLRRK
jgi:integrase